MSQKLTDLPQWKALEAHHAEFDGVHLRTLFADDPARASRYLLEAGSLTADYSKHLVTDETLRLLLELAEARGVTALRDEMFAGDKINITEGRAVLHTALRAPESDRIMVDGEDVVPEVHEVLHRMAAFAARVRSGEWVGATGKRIRTVVNIGFGGLTEAAKSPVHATGVGLCIYGVLHGKSKKGKKSGAGDDNFKKIFDKMKVWVKEFF
jgi:glucose-6-phosphate isomerase